MFDRWGSFPASHLYKLNDDYARIRSDVADYCRENIFKKMRLGTMLFFFFEWGKEKEG